MIDNLSALTLRNRCFNVQRDSLRKNRSTISFSLSLVSGSDFAVLPIIEISWNSTVHAGCMRSCAWIPVTRHGDCCVHGQAGGDRLRRYFSPTKEGRIMNKATTTSMLIAAVAALALSGGAYAQAAGSSGGGTSGSTASPANQMNGSTSGYGTPGTTNSDSGMITRAPNSGLPSSTSGNSTAGTSAPKTNNTLATPSTVSPAAGQ
jgi:hypothetical protein